MILFSFAFSAKIICVVRVFYVAYMYRLPLSDQKSAYTFSLLNLIASISITESGFSNRALSPCLYIHLTKREFGEFETVLQT